MHIESRIISDKLPAAFPYILDANINWKITEPYPSMPGQIKSSISEINIQVYSFVYNPNQAIRAAEAVPLKFERDASCSIIILKVEMQSQNDMHHFSFVLRGNRG